MPASQNFGKHEKLCRKKVIDQLFVAGDAFTVFPLRVWFMPAPLPEAVEVQVLFSVPKKRIKHAVQRNLLKRRMREAYRKNKASLLSVLSLKGQQYALAFVYLANEETPYAVIEAAMNKALHRLLNETEKGL